MKRILHYSSENTLYLILNIIAHDVIHDYGPSGCSTKRWEDNQILVKQFYNDYFTFSNPLLKGGDIPDSKRARTTTEQVTTGKLPSQPLQTGQIYPGTKIFSFIRPEESPSFPGQGTNLGSTPGFTPGFTLGSTSKPSITRKARRPGAMVQGLGQTIGTPKAGFIPFQGLGQTIGRPEKDIFTQYIDYEEAIKNMKDMINTTIMFTFFIHFNDININFQFSNYYIIPFDSIIDQSLFIDLCNKFIGYCNLKHIPNSLDYREYLDILCHFLSSSYAVEQTIFENIDFIRKRSREITTQYGGKKDPELDIDEAINLITQITELIRTPETNETLTLLTNLLKIKREELTQEQKNQYTLTRRNFLKNYKDILTSFNQIQKAGSIEGDFLYIPPIEVRRGRSSENINLLETFPQKIDALLYDVYQVIKEDEKLKYEQEKRRLDDLTAAISGNLTSQDKTVRQQFSSFIAKSGLFLTGICNKDGEINREFDALTDNSDLRKEINILLYIAGWTGNTGWNQVKNQDLDTVLISFFQQKYAEYQITDSTQDRYVCLTNNYVVNNSANVETRLKNKSFCPYSSILDGMPQCSWRTSVENREFGNMDFLITDGSPQSLGYNGKMEIAKDLTNLILSFEVKPNPVIALTGRKEITINGSDLEAHFVLKNTLVNIINYVLLLDDRLKAQIFAGDNIFENLFNLFVENNDFNIVYSEILFKGTGDLFQEINCVAKFGGYTMDNYGADSDILSYQGTTGNQLRFFAANDRPSGTRFIFMLINGNPNDINIKAVGGYYSGELLFLVKRRDNINICQLERKTKGGKKKKHTRKLNKRIKNKIKTKRH